MGLGVSITDSPEEGAAQVVMDRLARSIAAKRDWSAGFPRSRDDLQRELAGIRVEGVGPIVATELSEVAMGLSGEIRVAVIESGRAIIVVGRFSGDEDAVEVLEQLLGEEVSVGGFFAVRAVDAMGNIEAEESPRVRNALIGLRAAKE